MSVTMVAIANRRISPTLGLGGTNGGRLPRGALSAWCRDERTGDHRKHAMSKDLNPAKALMFRIVHRDNIPWILDHGLDCASAGILDPNYVPIGNADLISKRRQRVVSCPPRGSLSDYIPFYFTPFSPMMLNIQTGFGGVSRRTNEEIVILVSSIHKLQEQGIKFVFTDRHAYLQAAQFFFDLSDLDRIDWPILQQRDFKRDPDDPGKIERYQAEALVHRHLPVTALLGMACFTPTVAASCQAHAAGRDLSLRIIQKPGWYFP